MKDVPVTRVLTRELVTVMPDDTLVAAVRLMEQKGVHHLLVVENDRLCGILSSADTLKLSLLRHSATNR